MSLLVAVARLPASAKSETADLTAMWDFDLRDGFSGLHFTANRGTLAQP
jgi:hypothetical protein